MTNVESYNPIDTNKIKNTYLLNIYTKELCYINVHIESIVNDYNVSSNNNIELSNIISLSNELLLVYIINNNEVIDNYSKAYDFMMLSTIAVFWIVYKFLTNDSYITAYVLETYCYYTTSEILKKEIEILKTIDYNLYPIMIKDKMISL